MKFLSILMVVVFIMCALPLTISAEQNIIPADDENINYVGRWIKDENGKMAGSFECYLSLRFTGTSITLDKGSSGGMFYRVDGGEYERLTSKTLAKNLEEGEHFLEICAVAQQGFPKISGFILDEGATTLPIEKKPVIEFIGDSIMEGYIVNADKTANNSVLNSYGHKTAEKLGFYRNIIAFGGITMSQGYGNPDKQGMVNRYKMVREYTQNEPISPQWDTQKSTPDYIVINLGTNDGGVQEGEFKMWYLSFLSYLRTTYANVKIFVMTTLNGRHSDDIKAVVEGFNDKNCYLIDAASWNVYLGGDGTHPDEETHDLIAEKLATEINQILTATPEPDPTPDSTPSGNAPKKINWVLPVILTSALVLCGGIGTILAIKKKKNK